MAILFTFRTDRNGVIDFTAETARLHSIVDGSDGEALGVSLADKRIADAEISRRIRRLTESKDLSWDRANDLFTANAKADASGEEAALLKISQSGVMTMTNNPAVRS